MVLQFSRHIERNHPDEIEVQRILSKPKNSRERKELLANLRKKGNFIINSEGCKRPQKTSVLLNEEDYLPCTNCYGFYSKKQLWKHRKVCAKNLNSSSKTAQSDGQNFLTKQTKVDERLRNQVFPRMRPDSVSLVAKKDELICAYGSRYISVHREAHFVNVASRKMRELAKILIEIKKLNNNVRNLFHSLQPANFDLFVQATKIVVNYDETNQVFKSPTFALNLATTLKQCCEIAIVFVLKRKEFYSTIAAGEAEANLKTLIKLFESHWRYEISSQAANDLIIKKWNKITLVPLSSDLNILKKYLLEKAVAAISKLQSTNLNAEAYTSLVEIIFCQVIILNRRRPGELERMPLFYYKCSEKNCNDQKYEEFGNILTASEKILVKKFKRVVIRGKRGRGVPVLFSPEVQNHIDVMLKHRSNFISDDNPYLFGRPGYQTPICGYKTLSKIVSRSGVKNPRAITSTRLRKHLATITQVFSMTENDLEQLSTFMGHTTEVHKKSYRLPNDIYQTAKITKLLLLM
ncbi:uncharacterized protein [Diabrotica undecimpunctata]|uniref:uncharacterized protein n=1 Tax=Diabrotica undecimpunctata TaxID=50387 RepID=UPI003B63FB69